jgi:hypothetical protein
MDMLSVDLLVISAPDCLGTDFWGCDIWGRRYDEGEIIEGKKI